jgi:hypothetical protein
MAARVGRDPSVLVDNPRVTQLLAMGLGAVGGAYTADQSKPVRAAAMLGPLAIVQLLRHLELRSIQKSYDTDKRKRLRELDDKALLDNPGWFGGSNRLGAVNAYETMRDRKYKGYSSIAEAGDAFHLAASGLHPLLGVSMSGIVSALDNEEAQARRQMHKKAEFAEQRNSPVIPLTIAAALLGSLGRSASQNWAVREVSNTPPLGVDKWPGTIASISGTEPLMLASDADGTANAFFYKPDTEKEGLQFMRQFSGLRDVTPRTPTTKGEYGRAMEKLQRLMRSGVMVANERAGAPVIGHEAGHAKIEETPGMLRFLQRHIYPHQGWVAPMAAAGSMAAGLASGSTLKGGLYGTGIGLLSSLGTVGPEAGASYHALKHLKGLGDGSLSAEGKKDLLSALSTYLAGGVLPSVLSGMAGGWISGRRRKKEDEEDVEKSAALDLRKAWNVLRRIKTEGLTGDMADMLARPFDSTASTLQRSFFKHPDVVRAGIHPRLPQQKIQDMLKGLVAPPAIPVLPPPPAAPIQGMLDLFKQGQAHPALPALRAAKERSDAGDYAMKHKLIRLNMRRHANDWAIDSDDGKGIVGVTHIPTGFRLHMPKGIVDPDVLRYHNVAQPKPMSKQASTSENPWSSGIAGAGMLGLGGALGRSGLADLNNRNVLVTYGAAAPMGGGHKEPAAQIRQILEELKAQNRDNFLGRMNVIDAPVTSYEGKLSNEAAKAMKGKRFLTGIDTGWGLLDPERAHDITPSRASWMDRLRGENVRQQDPYFRQRFENFLQFQPDGRNDATGYMATGDARRISGLRDTHAATYGNFDPGPSHVLSGGKLHYMGRAHPLVETKNLSPLMDRDAYSKFLAQHMTQHGGFQGITPDTFRGKKIITVSGATRGDTVGARARWVAEALKAKGHNLDDYVIVGVGGQGPNLARETAIAHAGGPQKNIFIVPGTTAKTGGPSGFNSLIGNSDLHVMGMGGSGPFEALAHGGAPIALIDDEQVFKARQNVPWSESDLIADRGIHGFENKLRAMINQGLPADQHLAESAARNWMNPSVFQDAKGESVVRRGLDGIRDYLELRGVKTLQSGDYDGFANLLKELPQLQGGRAQQAALTLQDIQGGRGMFKSLLEGQLRAGRSAALRHGAGKLALGAGALAGGGALLSKLFGGNQTAQAPIDLRLNKAAATNTRDNVAIGAGGGAAVLGAGIYDTGRSFAKIRPLARDYVNATRRYAQKYPDHLWTADAPRIREYLGIVDKYADAAKAMSNLRIMGVPAHVLTSRFPLTSLADDWKTTLKVGLGMGDIVDQKKRWAIMDNQAHYAEGAKTPRALLSREMLSHAADPQLRLTPEVSRVMGADEALRIARAPEDVSMLQRFEPYLKRLEAGEVQGSTFDKLAPFFYRERRTMRGVNADDAPFMAGKGLRKFLQANSVRGYGSLLSAVSTKLSPKLKTVGALLGLAGLGTAGAGVYSKLNKD